MNYKHFLHKKDIVSVQSGFEPQDINSKLYDFQSEIVRWACKRGKAAIFADCGLGKTPMQLEWANQVHAHTKQPVLILAPLAVSKQTQREGDKFGVKVHICESQDDVKSGINITNYEKAHKFDPGAFSGIVLDESSILKSYTGKFRNYIIESFQKTPYKLACTATPAPNDFMELGNHSEFLNVLSRAEMLSLFFVNDTADVGTWRLKGHGEEKFWKWLCSWAVMLSKPSELGYDDNGFILPQLNIIEHVIEFGKPLEGCLFPQRAETLNERRAARRESVEEKVKIVLQLIGKCDSMRHNECGGVSCGNGSTQTTGKGSTTIQKRNEKSASLNHDRGKKTQNICVNTIQNIKMDGTKEQRNSLRDLMNQGESDTPQIQSLGKNVDRKRVGERRNSEEGSCFRGTDSQTQSMKECCATKKDAVQSAGQASEIGQTESSTSITATTPELSGVCCVPTAILESGNLETISNCSKRPLLIWVDLNAEQDELEKVLGDLAYSVRGTQDEEVKEDQIHRWINGERPVMISKASIMGWGLNLQHCADVVFYGLSDSYEAFYQAIRRCWRFGQKSSVNCHVITTDIEGNIVENIKRKEKDALRMRNEMIEHMRDISKSELREKSLSSFDYKTDVYKNHRYELHLGDNIELIKQLKDDSIGFSIFSPPFASLFTYTNSIRDMGNCRDKNDFLEHFRFLVTELHRVMMPGRLVAVHCMNLPMTLTHDGVMGVHDFRGDLIRLFQSENFIFHSEICIWKDPLVQAVRTKTLSLAHKQICKDSSRCAQGLPDYIVVMRKRGDNPIPIEHKHGLTEYIGEREFTNTNYHEDQRKNKLSHEIWQKYASPVWFDIRQTRVLSTDIARDEKDEKHVCPLQLDTIERCLELWSAKGDVVLDPFSGIGSTVYSAVSMGRYGIGFELKESYWRQSIKNMEFLESREKQGDLLEMI